MKIAVVLFFVSMHAMAFGYAQKVSLSAKNASIEKIFKEIRKQTGYQFLYTSRIVETARKVTIDVKDASLDEVLNQCFSNQPFTYEIKDKTIIVKSKPEPAEPAKTSSTPIDVKGRLVNEKGEPVAGASIKVKGTLSSVITNANGEFSLNGVSDDAILLISHVQYEDAMVMIKGNPVINATLYTKVSSLDETQVIAYGTVTKRLNSGNVFTIKARDLSKQPVDNPLQALEGRVPGVVVTQETGLPGGSYSVVIRGKNSIVNGSDPLYIIDGVPYSSQILPFNPTNTFNNTMAPGNNAIGGNKTPSPLNYINVNDIESIDVLKDADATAIYGSRGANGVILITTKKGKTGKTSVDFNVNTGVAQVAHKMKLLNTEQYLELRNEALANDKIATPATTDYDLNGTWDKTLYTDWQKQLIGGTAHYTDAQASVSGGNADIQYLINSGYHKETTVYPGDFGNNKGSLHFTLNTTSQNKKLKIQLSGNYITSLNHLPAADIMADTRMYPLSPPMYDVNGNINWQNNTWNNPMAKFLAFSKVRTKNLLGNATISYQLYKGLEIKADAGYSDLQLNDLAAAPFTASRPDLNVTTGTTGFGFNTLRSWILEPQLQYRFQVSDAKFEILAGSTIQQNTSDGFAISAAGYTDNSLLENMAGATTISKSNVSNTVYKYNAGFARLKYNWRDKYIINLTARRDGSSRFGPGKQFHNFGAAGVAWLFSNEQFVRDALPILSYGKIRLSYGTTGSDQVGDYRFIDTYSYITANYTGAYQGSAALFPDNLFNADLAWEVNKKAEAALEIGLLQDRIFLSASYYRNRSSNQLIKQPLPDITGFSGVYVNLPALVQNQGWEFMARSYNVKTKDFSWVSMINFTKQENKLMEFPSLEQSTSYAPLFVIGQPLTVKQLYHNIGVDPSKGIYRFLTRGGDTTSAPASGDKYIMMNIDPKFFGGFQNTFTWKNFELDCFFQFVKQNGLNPLFLNKSNMPGTFARYSLLNLPAEILDNRWQKADDQASIQKFSTTTGPASIAYTAAVGSDFGYVDASYIRLKNLSLSYRLPQTWVKNMHMQNVRIYIQGQNVFTITNYKGYDPENAPLNPQALPPLRVITGGVQVNL